MCYTKAAAKFPQILCDSYVSCETYKNLRFELKTCG